MINGMAIPAMMANGQSLAFRPAARAPRSSRQTAVTTRAGFLDFLNPGAAGGNNKTMKKPARSVELVEQLLDLTASTEAGIRASAALREEIEDVVEELSKYCMKSPLRSDLIFGEWEVVYASKPQTAGGPFRSPIGRAVFPKQRAIQIISEPNVCINEVSYKAFGFVPGAARQEGEIEPVDETTFQITFPALNGKKGGPPTRLIEVAYLDDRIRVARALPQNDDADGGEGSFYVFTRVEEEEEEEEEEQEDEEEEVEQPKFSPFSFGTQIFKKEKEGRATQAERAVEQRGGKLQTTVSGRRTAARTPPAAAAAPVQKKSREEMAAERAAAQARAVEERKAAAETAATARAQLEQERKRAREQAEEEKRQQQAAAVTERQAKVERQAAARAQYAELASEATDAANEARDASAALKSAEKEVSGLLRAAAQAREIIDAAVAAAQEATSELTDAQKTEFSLDKQVQQEQRMVNQLQKKLRDVSASIAPKFSKK